MQMIKSYFSQLLDLARDREVDLEEATQAAGLPASTYWRWSKGKAEPQLDKARLVARAIAQLAHNRRKR